MAAVRCCAARRLAAGAGPRFEGCHARCLCLCKRDGCGSMRALWRVPLRDVAPWGAAHADACKPRQGLGRQNGSEQVPDRTCCSGRAACGGAAKEHNQLCLLWHDFHHTAAVYRIYSQALPELHHVDLVACCCRSRPCDFNPEGWGRAVLSAWHRPGVRGWAATLERLATVYIVGGAHHSCQEGAGVLFNVVLWQVPMHRAAR
jgi:hypothetical protein